MTIEIIISSAIVSALITVIGGIITTAMANKAAAKTAVAHFMSLAPLSGGAFSLRTLSPPSAI